MKLGKGFSLWENIHKQIDVRKIKRICNLEEEQVKKVLTTVASLS